MIAIALISGGLDSLLAANLIKNQGVRVVGLHYKIPFCKTNLKESFPDIGIPLVEFDLTAEFLALLVKPRYGFGSHMNPCIDCKILMLKKTKELLERFEAKFIITGEVLGQRPMSQNKQSLEAIKRDSGLEDLLLRPLSAQFFPPTLAEREGWVDRKKLLGFNGRQRRPQMELAKAMGIQKYATPAGGCLLTDPCFSQRLKELMSHGELNAPNLELLKVGRHFRVADKAKLVVGRNEKENSRIVELSGPRDYLFLPREDIAGPTCLARGELNPEQLELCGRIVCAYCDILSPEDTVVMYRRAGQKDCATLKAEFTPKENFVYLRI